MIVKVYSTPTCPWCARTKAFLKELKIPFEDIDVSKNQKAAMYMVIKTGQMGVPVIEIGKDFVIGFDPQRILELIKKYGIHQM